MKGGWSLSPDALEVNPVWWFIKLIGYIRLGFGICAVVAYFSTREKR